MKNFNFKEGEQIEDTLPQAHDFDKENKLEGYFLGSEENVGENNSTIYRFETKDGIVAVWDTAQLKRLMQSCQTGNPYEIEFVGFEPIKNSENKFRKFMVTNLETA